MIMMDDPLLKCNQSGWISHPSWFVPGNPLRSNRANRELMGTHIAWWSITTIQQAQYLHNENVGDHLAECCSMALVQVPFPKIKNLPNFAAFSGLWLVLKMSVHWSTYSSVTHISITVHLHKCKPLALIQVTSLTEWATVKENIFYPFTLRLFKHLHETDRVEQESILFPKMFDFPCQMYSLSTLHH